MQSEAHYETGLLEQPTLRFRRHPPISLLLDARGLTVGFTTWKCRGLWAGAPGSILAVHEQEQGPLLCAIHREWSLRWHWRVQDAEGDLVGRVEKDRILDPWGTLVLFCRKGSWFTLHGVELARLEQGNQFLELQMLPPVQHDPFAKMLLLAATLVH
ncbi:MAG: hypothetical protein U0840_05565 [Gemmataceae bacterium]